MRPSTLLLALAITSPALWRAFVVGDLDISGVLVRFLIAVPVSMVMVAILHALTAGYRKPRRRTGTRGADPPEEPGR